VPRLAPGRSSFLSRPCGPVAPLIGRRSARASTDAAYPRLLDGPSSRLFCLAPEGVFRAAAVAGTRGGLLPHLFTLTAKCWVKERVKVASLHLSLSHFSLTQTAQRFVFCDTVRRHGLTRGARAWREPCAASCPVVSGLSSPKFKYRHGVTRALGSKNPERRPGPGTKENGEWRMQNGESSSATFSFFVPPRCRLHSKFYILHSPFAYCSHQTMRPHWSHTASSPPLPRAADSTSLEIFKWQPPHLASWIGTQAGKWYPEMRS